MTTNDGDMERKVLVAKSRREIHMICGSRGYKDRAGVEGWARTLEKTHCILIHGDCKDSPDVWAGAIAESMGVPVGKFPYMKAYARSGGHFRNRVMVDLADRIIFFWDGKSHGTGSTIEYAKSQKKLIEIRSLHD